MTEIEQLRADNARLEAQVAGLRKALTWIENRRPRDIQSNGTIGSNVSEHGRAAYDMWACARAALSAHDAKAGEGTE